MLRSAIENATVDAVLAHTQGPASLPVITTQAGIAVRLAAKGFQVDPGPVTAVGDSATSAVVLIADELSEAGDQADALVHHVARVLEPGGLLAVTARNSVFDMAAGFLSDSRGFDSSELDRLLGHYGFTTVVLCAPGAAARIRASVELPGRAAEEQEGVDELDVDSDRRPGLLGAAPRLFALATRAENPAQRSARFVETLPRKVVAAAVLCRTDDGRVLIVHDVFKRHWSIPGGVVDPDENPRDAAERETLEESGIRVAAGAVLGTFQGAHPDRIVLVYDGLPIGGGAPAPAPTRPHEVDAAEWVTLEEALVRLAPHVAFQVRRCLREPGGTWTQPRP